MTEQGSSQSQLPTDPIMLLSVVNTLLRDKYPEGLKQLCEDMNLDSEELNQRLKEAGFEYIPSVNQYR